MLFRSPLAAEAPAGEERKVVSVLFVDLVGFTGRSDRADPEDVRATLRPYHERVKADIEEDVASSDKWFLKFYMEKSFHLTLLFDKNYSQRQRSGSLLVING